MTTGLPPIESHAVHSDRLMRHAWRELENGDRLQASEKAWGAVAHRLKAIAAIRGWRYDTHSQAFGIMDRLEAELGEPELKTIFHTANELHKNYYADTMTLQDIRIHIASIERLLDILRQVE